jgi:hypothetical protein
VLGAGAGSGDVMVVVVVDGLAASEPCAVVDVASCALGSAACLLRSRCFSRRSISAWASIAGISTLTGSASGGGDGGCGQ